VHFQLTWESVYAPKTLDPPKQKGF